MNPLCLQKELESNSNTKLKIKINDNRSTMLSVKWDPDCTKVSLHRMFLDAPRNIMEELACYIRREKKIISPSVKAFIEDNLPKLDYSSQIDPKKLNSQGSFYNLKKIYETLNSRYFKGDLNLLITWFGDTHKRNRTIVTFGLYYDPLKLIKIHRMLDTPAIPDYVISFVIYHEMLHHICPAYVDEKGVNRVHNKEFKLLEKKFDHYNLAKDWIRKHHYFLFK